MRKRPPETWDVRLAKLWLGFLICMAIISLITSFILWTNTMVVILIVVVSLAGVIGVVIATGVSIEIMRDYRRAVLAERARERFR